MLCGGAGYAYGSDLWGFPSNWRDIMGYRGAFQLSRFIRFFESIPWWTLRPDTVVDFGLPNRDVDTNLTENDAILAGIITLE